MNVCASLRPALASFAAFGLGACIPGQGVTYETTPGRYSPVLAGTPESSFDSGEPIRPALFVANKRGNSISKIDLETGEEIVRRDSCTNPHELATSPQGNLVALACYGGTTVDLFDTRELALVASIELGENARPHGIVWGQNDTIYVTTEGRGSIVQIRDPASFMRRIREYPTEQQGSHMLAIAPDWRTAWTVDMESNTVTRLDLSEQEPPRSVKIGEQPEGIALSTDATTLWVSARGSDMAFALDPETLAVRSMVRTGRFPLRLAIRPQGDVAITSNLRDGSLSVIDLDTTRLVRKIDVSSSDEAQERAQVTILWADDGERIYVAETASNTVAEIDYASGQVLRRLATGEGGDGLAIVP
ncbi:MAG: YncE family protein [Erythrobacter sp.]|nr:YncE family protein [Erythrobacter sp.]